MSRKPADPQPPRLIDIASAIVVVAAVVVVVSKSFLERSEPQLSPPPITTEDFSRPIASEANVFRVQPGDVGVAPAFEGDSSAHVRSLDMHRRLRAFPGAPPRIPHGLTDGEFRVGGCGVCHEKGGWVARFSTYAPITPHPEYSSCLQCHLPQDTLVGRMLPTSEETPVCGQCHWDPDAPLDTFVELDWRTATWPETGQQALPDSPPGIPHDFQMRSNCLACHSGPGAVLELRTDHPERANCRQCHVQASEAVGVFPTDPNGSTDGPGGES